jgi:hypothetical protein
MPRRSRLKKNGKKREAKEEAGQQSAAAGPEELEPEEGGSKKKQKKEMTLSQQIEAVLSNDGQFIVMSVLVIQEKLEAMGCMKFSGSLRRNPNLSRNKALLAEALQDGVDQGFFSEARPVLRARRLPNPTREIGGR